ncbi:hypothetical protein AGMMS50293_14590 [Spirochaetia bacterium]|nr:hypothetical protein AGMMS50293_14590 [Spirochaetia bacterium]
MKKKLVTLKRTPVVAASAAAFTVAFAATALVLAVLFASCAPALSAPGDGEEVIPYKAYIKISSGLSGKSARSLTPTQLLSQINYYELIVEKLGDAPNYVPTGNFTSARSFKRSGSLIVPVDEGATYNVLLLQGYRTDDGTSATLLGAEFWERQTVIAGPNELTVTGPYITIDPTTDFSMTLNGLTPVATGVLPRLAVRNPTTQLMELSIPTTTATATADNTLTITINGVTALLSALKGEAVTADPTGDFTPGTDILFTQAKIKREQSFGAGSTDDAVFVDWSDAPLAFTDYNYYANSTLGSISLKKEIPMAWYPKTDASVRIYLDFTYYGFVRKVDSGGLGGTPAWTAVNAQDAGFQKWTVRNGLNAEWDISGKVGGGVLLKVGDGGSGLGTIPTIVVNP